MNDFAFNETRNYPHDYYQLPPVRTRRQETEARAHACFMQSLYWRKRGNDVLREIRERPFDNHDIIDSKSCFKES